MRVFLVGAAIDCAGKLAKRKLPRYDTVNLLSIILHHGGEVCLCNTCIENWAVEQREMLEGCGYFSTEELAGWIG